MTGVEESFRSLLRNNHSGSSEILKQTVEWARASVLEGSNSSQILQGLAEICRTHPAMALLYNFASHLGQTSFISADTIDRWMQTYREHETEACRHFSRHLSAYSNVLVHSYSRLLYESLKMAPNVLNIYCTESRPVFEGRFLAEKLSRTHHRIHLIADMAAFNVLPRIDILAFGCDSITSRGIINKIGTAALAEIGKRQGRMNYFVATSEKVLNHWDENFLMRQGPPEEIYAGPQNIMVENHYFDLTTISCIDGLVLETGLSGCSDYAQTFAN